MNEPAQAEPDDEGAPWTWVVLILLAVTALMLFLFFCTGGAPSQIAPKVIDSPRATRPMPKVVTSPAARETELPHEETASPHQEETPSPSPTER